MEGTGPSRTAVGAAVGRALHLTDPAPKVIEDRFALDLAGEAGRANMAEMQAMDPSVQHSYALSFVVRARYVEDMVEEAVAEGIGQYVILGAGLDSFAYRRGDLLDRLRVFEVDHPASQEWKRGRVRELGIDVPDGLLFAPIDFEVEALIDGLRAAGFDAALPAAISWVAVSQYLTPSAVDATLRAVASLPVGTRMAMTYVVPPEALDAASQKGFYWISERVKKLGEPFLTLFEPRQLEELLLGLGFSEVAHFDTEDAKRTYLSDRADPQLPNIERYVTATV